MITFDVSGRGHIILFIIAFKHSFDVLYCGVLNFALLISCVNTLLNFLKLILCFIRLRLFLLLCFFNFISWRLLLQNFRNLNLYGFRTSYCSDIRLSYNLRWIKQTSFGLIRNDVWILHIWKDWLLWIKRSIAKYDVLLIWGCVSKNWLSLNLFVIK